MESNQTIKFSFNAIMIQDKNYKGFTAYFKQFPNIIAEGENEESAMANLFNALHDVFMHKSDSEATPKEKNMNVIERSVNFELA